MLKLLKRGLSIVVASCELRAASIYLHGRRGNMAGSHLQNGQLALSGPARTLSSEAETPGRLSQVLFVFFCGLWVVRSLKKKTKKTMGNIGARPIRPPLAIRKAISARVRFCGG
jgi:hypothetical protein